MDPPIKKVTHLDVDPDLNEGCEINMIRNVILDSALDILSSERGGKCEERRRDEREVKRVNRTDPTFGGRTVGIRALSGNLISASLSIVIIEGILIVEGTDGIHPRLFVFNVSRDSSGPLSIRWIKFS